MLADSDEKITDEQEQLKEEEGEIGQQPSKFDDENSEKEMKVDDDEDKQLEKKQEDDGSSTSQWKGDDGQGPEGSPPPLPDGWSWTQDPKTKRVYYFNVENGTRQWTFPTIAPSKPSSWGQDNSSSYRKITRRESSPNEEPKRRSDSQRRSRSRERMPYKRSKSPGTRRRQPGYDFEKIIDIHPRRPCFHNLGLLIGSGGENVKKINHLTNSSVQIRGQGNSTQQPYIFIQSRKEEDLFRCELEIFRLMEKIDKDLEPKVQGLASLGVRFVH